VTETYARYLCDVQGVFYERLPENKKQGNYYKNVLVPL